MTLCRSLYAVYDREVTVYDIDAYKFTIPESVLAAPNDNPDNECFCVETLPLYSEEDCFDMAGMMSLGACSAGNNIFVWGKTVCFLRS